MASEFGVRGYPTIKLWVMLEMIFAGNDSESADVNKDSDFRNIILIVGKIFANQFFITYFYLLN